MLTGKIAFVTGAGQGIGRSIAKYLAENNATVYANDFKTGSIDKLCKEINNQRKGHIIPIYFDVTDTESAKKAFIKIKKEQGRLDVLINNAGIMKDAVIGMVTHEVMEKTFDVNVFAVMELLQMAAKIMMRQKSGSIINMASIVGVHGNKGQLVYSASKGAVIALTKTAAKELAKYNIRVNSIAPGMIDTDMFKSIGETHIAEHLSNIGMHRLGTPEDVAKTALFLASDLSEYVTGQIIGVDGSAMV